MDRQHRFTTMDRYTQKEIQRSKYKHILLAKWLGLAGKQEFCDNFTKFIK